MDWFIGGKQDEAKRLLSQLSDITQRERVALALTKDGPENPAKD